MRIPWTNDTVEGHFASAVHPLAAVAEFQVRSGCKLFHTVAGRQIGVDLARSRKPEKEIPV